MKQLVMETYALFSRPSSDAVMEFCFSPEGPLPTLPAAMLRSTLQEGRAWALESPSSFKAFWAVWLWTIYLAFLNFSFLH